MLHRTLERQEALAGFNPHAKHAPSPPKCLLLVVEQKILLETPAPQRCRLSGEDCRARSVHRLESKLDLALDGDRHGGAYSTLRSPDPQAERARGFGE